MADANLTGADEANSNTTGRFTVEEVPCVITGDTYPVKVKAGEDAPNRLVSPPALIGASILDENEDLPWVKVAQVNYPNGTKDWIVESPKNTEDFEDFGLEHGAVYRSDFVEGFQETTEENDYAHYQGRIDEKIKSGLPGFKVTRNDLTRPRVRGAIDQLREEIEEAEAKRTEIEGAKMEKAENETESP
jgi:hypothetical protein